MDSSKHKIIEFKSKEQQFEQWWKDVYDTNFKDQSIKSALVIFETADKDGCQAHSTRFECDLLNLKWFHRCLGEFIQKADFDKWMREHVNEYIEYLD